MPREVPSRKEMHRDQRTQPRGTDSSPLGHESDASTPQPPPGQSPRRPPEPTGPVEIKTNVPVRPPAAVAKGVPALSWHPVEEGALTEDSPETPVKGVDRRSIRNWRWRSGATVLLVGLILTPGLARLEHVQEQTMVDSSISTMSERPVGG